MESARPSPRSTSSSPSWSKAAAEASLAIKTTATTAKRSAQQRAMFLKDCIFSRVVGGLKIN